MISEARGTPAPVAVEIVHPMGRTALAVGCGWLVPGLGHVLLGRVRRGFLFALLIFGSFALGLAHDGRLALRDQRTPFISAMQVVANAGVGVADVVARIAVYGEAAYTLPPTTNVRVEDERRRIMRDRTRSSGSIYGTAYLWTAGVMNLLLLFDVWDIGRGRKA